MEEKNIEEPIQNLESDLADAKQSQAETPEGSIYGKFKDAKDLLQAYNALQSEFTRKSQKLADFQRKEEEYALFSKTDSKENKGKIDKSDLGEYKKEAAEMTNENENENHLPNNFSATKSPDKNAEETLAKILNSQDFFDKYISNNDEIKNKILEEYLSKLNNLKSAPKIVSGSTKSVHFAPNSVPKTFKEAGEILSKMLN